ncbi:DnaJ-domain-containing protein [Auriculariales sp. MPI-PUGE-AT-0066]|nr:DnaJ-domain-containing protein [Auriculariales sp. MPI-PUGE-AT-0066]
MRLFSLVLALACILASALAWDKEDYEIFDLQSGIEATEGKGITFYSWLDVPSTASSSEIAKAYRKKSLQLHPDKNPGVKDIEARYARLGVVQKILRSENRERYDFFYKNGFPRWRGTGYYYSRFRPGVVTVLAFLTLITAGLQHMVHRMNYSRDVARVERIITAARRAAWGPKLVRVEGRRKVKVNIGGESAQVDEDGHEYGMGRFLDLVVDGDSVWLLEANGDLTPLDSSVATKPSWGRTWPVALGLSLVGRFFPKAAEGHASTTEALDDTEQDDSEVPSGYSTPSGRTAGKANGAAKRRKSARK